MSAVVNALEKFTEHKRLFVGAQFLDNSLINIFVIWNANL
jgi:hypothetical protein